MLPTISQEKVALITDEWNMYMAGAVDTDDTDCAEERVDHFKRNLTRATLRILLVRSLWLMVMM